LPGPAGALPYTDASLEPRSVSTRLWPRPRERSLPRWTLRAALAAGGPMLAGPPIPRPAAVTAGPFRVVLGHAAPAEDDRPALFRLAVLRGRKTPHNGQHLAAAASLPLGRAFRAKLRHATSTAPRFAVVGCATLGVTSIVNGTHRPTPLRTAIVQAKGGARMRC
jgi:hypothetical protein